MGQAYAYVTTGNQSHSAPENGVTAKPLMRYRSKLSMLAHGPQGMMCRLGSRPMANMALAPPFLRL